MVSVTQCGLQSIESSAVINTKFECKKLRLSEDKSVKLHVSKRRNNNNACSVVLRINGETMKEVTKTSYLGDILSERADYSETIESRVRKAIGINAKIQCLLTSLSLGMFHFEIAFVLRESMLLNSILLNTETHYFLSKKQIESLESCDAKMMQNTFGSIRTTVREAYYLEGGKIQIRHILSKRRLMYHFHILTRDPKELIRKVYEIQILKPCKDDYHKLILKEKERYNINFSDEQIREMGKSKYKKLVNNQVNSIAFHEMMSSTKSKLQGIIKSTKQTKDKKSQVQEYLLTNKLTTKEKQTIFELRCRNYDVKTNFSSNFTEDMSCRLCNDPQSIENEEHIFSTDCQSSIQVQNSKSKFADVYGSLNQQVQFIKTYMDYIRKRRIILKQKP